MRGLSRKETLMAKKIVARTGFTAANDATDLNQVGSIMDDGSNGKQYRYVRVEDMDLAANDVVEFADATGTVISNTRLSVPTAMAPPRASAP